MPIRNFLNAIYLNDSDNMQSLESFSTWFSLSLLRIFRTPKRRPEAEEGENIALLHRRRRHRRRRPHKKPSVSDFVLLSDSPEHLRGFLLRLFLGNDPVPREVIHLIPWGPVFDSFARECLHAPLAIFQYDCGVHWRQADFGVTVRLSPKQFSSRLGVPEGQFSDAVCTYVQDDDPMPLGDILSAPIERLRQSEIFEKMISACWNEILEKAERRRHVVGNAQTDEASLARELLPNGEPRGRRHRRKLKSPEANEAAEIARAKSEERKAKKRQERQEKARSKEEKRLRHEERRRDRIAKQTRREEERWDRTVQEMHEVRTREEQKQRLKAERNEELRQRMRRHARHEAEEQAMGWNEGFRDRGRRFGLPFAEARLPEERS